jgi:hypothetical protein
MNIYDKNNLRKSAQKRFDDFMFDVEIIYNKIIADAKDEAFQKGLGLKKSTVNLLSQAEKFSEGRLSAEEFSNLVQNWKTQQEEKNCCYMKSLMSDSVRAFLNKAKMQRITNN